MEQQSQLAIYDQHAQRAERAFQAFSRVYALEHPLPQPPSRWTGLPWMVVPFGLIALAGIALSALRTAPVFAAVAEPLVGQSLAAVEAVLAVIVVEVSIVIMRYVIVLQNEQDGKLDAAVLQRWMMRGFGLAFTVAILANIYASISHIAFLAGIRPIADLVIAVAVGISAPILAFVSGDVLGSIVVRAGRVRQQAAAHHRAALDDWEAARERRWNARKADYGLRISVEGLTASGSSVPVLSDQTDNGQTIQTIPAPSGFTRTPDGQRRVIAWLDAHREDAGLSVRKLAERIGAETGVSIGHDTAAKGLRAWKQSTAAFGAEVSS